MYSVRRNLTVVVAVDSGGTIVESDPEEMVGKKGLEETIARKDSREKVR